MCIRDRFYTNGWQYLKTDDTYLIFLKNLGGIDAVSYTHLDVYKRQQEDGSLLISGPNSNVMCNDSNMYAINSCLLYTSRCV